MSLKTIAIMSPGSMGSAVGKAIKSHGFSVITSLDGRSERTKQMAQTSGIEDVGNLSNLVKHSDLILSILVPSQAHQLAERIAEVIKNTNSKVIFADCNAISPASTKQISNTIISSGGDFIDSGIIGGPPNEKDSPRFYVSGPNATQMTKLDGKGITVRFIDKNIGSASAMKMCYAALTKGTSTLHIALLAAAEMLGVSSELELELEYSQKDTLKNMSTGISRIPSNAHRWIGEMEEIASTFKSVGVPSGFHEGAAEIYKLLNKTIFASETPETIDKSRTTKQTIQELTKFLETEKS